MTGRFQAATLYLFVICEALAWFIALRVVATSIDHSAMRALLDQVTLVFPAAAPAEPAGRAAAALRQALDGLASGPSAVVVIGAAYLALYVSRGVRRLRAPGGLGVLLGLALSVLLLNAVLHVALAGDLRVWDGGGAGRFLADPQGAFGERTAEGWVTNPDPARLPGSSFTFVVTVMVALWVRFAYVGGGSVAFPRVLRSFSVGFAVVLLAALAAPVSGVGIAPYVVGYFVLALLALTTANVARSSDVDWDIARATPWAVSAVATLGVLAGVAMLLGLLALIDIGSALAPVGSLLLALLDVAIRVLFTPLAWLMEVAMRALLGLLGGGAQQAPGGTGDFTPLQLEERAAPRWAAMLGVGARVLLLALLALAAYRLARALFRRGRGGVEAERFDEERAAAGGSGAGSLLRHLLPQRARRPGVPPWLDRHAVYRLFARVVNDAADRGVERAPGETPLRFADTAARVLDAPTFAAIAAEFDRARYGRHFPAADRLAPLASALGEWEQAHPAPERPSESDTRRAERLREEEAARRAGVRRPRGLGGLRF